jgi:hypothetical protein
MVTVTGRRFGIVGRRWRQVATEVVRYKLFLGMIPYARERELIFEGVPEWETFERDDDTGKRYSSFDHPECVRNMRVTRDLKARGIAHEA